MKKFRFGLVFGALVAVGCNGGQRPNLVLVTIDTCRADRLSCYGYQRETTPNLDRLASEGVLFEDARTCVPITLPSHVSIMTGLYPAFHGVHENGLYKAADSLLTLAEILKGNGYATAAFVGSFPLDSRFNLDQGFDHYGDSFGQREGQDKPAMGGVSIFFAERPADEVNWEFFHWLEDHVKEPFFVWIHYFDPHQPFEPRPPYDAMFAGRPYDAEIAFVDACVGQLRERLEDTGLLERTILAITADHGEALGEHGELTHALLLYDSTLRVPLILRFPRPMGIIGTVREPVRTVDLAPTLLELLGLEPPRTLHGTSVVDLIHGGKRAEHDHYYETFYGRLHFGWSVLLGFQSGPWKYIYGPKPELYDTVADPEENKNQVHAYPDTAEALKEKLFSLISQAPEEGHAAFSDPDKETEARLIALGYVGSWEKAGHKTSWFDGANPMDMMEAHEWYNLGRGYVHQGQWLEAALAFRRALQANEHNKDARIGLVSTLLHSGDHSAALKEAEKTVALYPEQGDVWMMLAGLLFLHGRHDEALRASHKGLDNGGDPVDGWMMVGRCTEQAGDHAKAVQAYERILEIDPTILPARLRLATCLARLGGIENAENEFRLAIQNSPYWAPVHYNFGVFLLDHDRTEEATTSFERAVQLSPTYAAAHHALAILYRKDGKNEAALQHVEAVIRYARDQERRHSALTLKKQLKAG